MKIHTDSVIKRFWKYVDRREEDQCWPWTGSKMVRGGYGQLNDRGRLLKAHRISWEISNGCEIPKKLFACHRCNNKGCCNPSHIYAGTPKDNWNDTVQAQGLRLPANAPKGEKHHSAKLNLALAKEIRKSNESGVALGRRLGVSKSTISRVRRGKVWKEGDSV